MALFFTYLTSVALFGRLILTPNLIFFGPKGSFYIIDLIILLKPSAEQQGLIIDLNGVNKSSAEQQDFILVDNGRLFWVYCRAARLDC